MSLIHILQDDREEQPCCCRPVVIQVQAADAGDRAAGQAKSAWDRDVERVLARRELSMAEYIEGYMNASTYKGQP